MSQLNLYFGLIVIPFFYKYVWKWGHKRTIIYASVVSRRKLSPLTCLPFISRANERRLWTTELHPTSSTRTMPSAITQHPRSVDDLVKSVNDTLASWKSAFDVKPSDAASNSSTRSPTSAAAATDKSPCKLWKEEQRIYLSQEAYRQRLETFRPDSYFAKPLALSPLVCAAFG